MPFLVLQLPRLSETGASGTLSSMAAEKKTCEWPSYDPLLTVYHDAEWDVPVHDDGKHFEFLVLEISQASLSWHTILKKREHYRRAFDNIVS